MPRNNLLADIPTNTSIIVLANYRTGSTALCNILSKNYKIQNYDEFFNTTKPDILNEKFIIKIMPDHNIPKSFNEKFNDSFVIGLKRKSLVDQIISFYICHMTQVWHYKNISQNMYYEIKIDELEIINQSRYILKMTENYNNNNLRKDLEIYYEDIIDIIEHSDYTIYPKPANYVELFTVVTSKLKGATVFC